MPLPNGFSPAEHLQDISRKSINKEVAEWFRDTGPDNWDPDLSSARGSLRIACTHQENDTLSMTLQRTMLFYLVCKKAADFATPVYGIPTTEFQAKARFQPQITLFFLEDLADVDAGYSPITGEISFRLTNQTSETLSQAEAVTYANRTKIAFSSGSGFVWRKGKITASYRDESRGYRLKLYVRDEAEGKRIIEQVLDVQQHTPEWENLTLIQNDQPAQAYPTLPPNQLIMGKNRRLPRKRPIGDVRFQYAFLHVWGVTNPIVLVDRSGRFNSALAN